MSENAESVAPLYAPQNPHETPTIQLLHKVNAKYALDPPLASYEDLWRFSTERIADFWDTVWDEVEVVGEKAGITEDKGAGEGFAEDGVGEGTRGYHVVDELKSPADNPDWFRDAKLNWAENMLLKKWRDDEGRVAMIQVGEHPKYLSVVFTQDEFFFERALASISDTTVC